jgi:hypothetical protein
MMETPLNLTLLQTSLANKPKLFNSIVAEKMNRTTGFSSTNMAHRDPQKQKHKKRLANYSKALNKTTEIGRNAKAMTQALPSAHDDRDGLEEATTPNKTELGSQRNSLYSLYNEQMRKKYINTAISNYRDTKALYI